MNLDYDDWKISSLRDDQRFLQLLRGALDPDQGDFQTRSDSDLRCLCGDFDKAKNVPVDSETSECF